MQSKHKEKEKEITEKYGTFVLNPKQTSEIVNKSESTLERWRKRGENLKYRKIGKAKNSPIEYSIESVAEYIINYDIKIVK